MPKSKAGLRLRKLENHVSELTYRVRSIEDQLRIIRWLLYWVSSAVLAIVLKMAVA